MPHKTDLIDGLFRLMLVPEPDRAATRAMMEKMPDEELELWMTRMTAYRASVASTRNASGSTVEATACP